MSGGSLDYFYSQLEDHENDFGDKELNHLVKDLAELFHDREWYLSGDTGKGDWNEARDNFKAKWFTEHGRQERIEQYLADFADEIRQSFGISQRYCKNCSHWKALIDPKNRHNGEYGDCDLHSSCLWHRSDSCEKFEANEAKP